MYMFMSFIYKVTRNKYQSKFFDNEQIKFQCALSVEVKKNNNK